MWTPLRRGARRRARLRKDGTGLPHGLSSILATRDVKAGVAARCQRDVLGRLAAHAAASFKLDEAAVFDQLMARERLGSTGIGRGVAIPHAMASVPVVRGVCFALKRPIDFDAVDDVPVDLVFLLLAPKGDDTGHIKALSRVARRLRVDGVQASLRGARSDQALYEALMGDERVAA